MLTELRITNLGVIAEASIEFSPGLTALTGETGAGKTMVVAGLGQLLGARATAGIVRHGAARAAVEGRWILAPEQQISATELGAEIEEGELLTVRQVGATGRSRVLIGGTQATVGNLSALVGEWATIHGQSEQIRLGTPERQRDLLDAFGRPAELGEYRTEFDRYRALEVELATLVAQAQERAREIDLLEFGLGEIAQVEPIPGEDQDLAAEASRLQSSDELRQLAEDAQLALSGAEDAVESPGGVGLVGSARKLIEQAAELDPTASELAARLIELNLTINDLAADVSSYRDGLPSDPLRLEAVMARRAQLASLTRKYGTNVAEVLDWADQAATRLGELQAGDERIGILRRELEELDARLTVLASGITKTRIASAKRLAAAVTLELAALAMPHARLEFTVTPAPERNAFGADRIELLFAANPGAPLASLAKVASGGELSRVRLALEVVLAGTAPGHTFVFDEVDAGVGGAVGLEIGRRLARLATTSQVIVVTHLAQVAAFADSHLVVTKSSDGEVTASNIQPVSGDARASELARMMAGLGDSAAAQSHAADLLAEAGRAG